MEQYCIVRGDRSGVFFGKITKQSRNGKKVKLSDARCLWRWEGAATILQLAQEGTSSPSDCRFTITVPSLEITDCIEVVPCTEEAVESIKAVIEWKA